MTEILASIASVPALIVGLAALVRYARRDVFAGPRNRRLPHDELGAVAYGRRVPADRPARRRIAEHAMPEGRRRARTPGGFGPVEATISCRR